MTKAELEVAFRSATNDIATPYIWSTEDVSLYLSEAEKEAATRANLIIDETTSAYCQISLEIGTDLYPLDPLVLDVIRAKIGTSSPMSVTTEDKLDISLPTWETETGEPTEYFLIGQSIRVVPTPTEIATLKLVVSRLPVTMAAGGPEIHPRYHHRMLDWAFYLAYSKRDADAENPKLAAEYKEEFSKSFGDWVSASGQTIIRRHNPPTIKSW